MIKQPQKREPSLYYTRYLELNTGNNLFEALESVENETISLVLSLSQDKINFAYALGKWPIGVLLQHICDAERVYAYRAFRFLKGDSTVLPGFDEDDYAQKSIIYPNFEAFVLEYGAVRNASVQLFKHADVAMLDFVGNANGIDFTPRELAWLMVGHNKHHLNILRERYL